MSAARNLVWFSRVLRVTNAGIAGPYVVFAKVHGEAFTAFLVLGESPGLSCGAPKRKMGLRVSPTASVVLEQLRIPRDHVLGEMGKGHRVAFSILNLGRIKLGFSSLGCAREALALAAVHSRERRQFGRRLGELPLVRAKLADMAARVFLLEGACVRVAGALDTCLPEGFGNSPAGEAAAALKRFAVPSALLKLLGSEYLGAVVDEAVQIHGGYGFMEDYAVCRMYRDARVNRIFEGTNEINRLLAAGGLLRDGLAGGWPMADLLARGRGPAPVADSGAAGLCEVLRWTLGRVAGAAIEQLGAKLEEEQTVLAQLADLALEIFALDTALARGAACGQQPRLAALIEVAGEAVRGRILPKLVQLAATLFGPGEAATLVAPVVAGALSTTEESDEVASAVLDGGGLP